MLGAAEAVTATAAMRVQTMAETFILKSVVLVLLERCWLFADVSVKRGLMTKSRGSSEGMSWGLYTFFEAKTQPLRPFLCLLPCCHAVSSLLLARAPFHAAGKAIADSCRMKSH